MMYETKKNLVFKISLFLFLGVLLGCQNIAAQNCGVTIVAPVAFGAFNPKGANLDAIGTLRIDCSGNASINYTLTLNTGGVPPATFNPRKMTQGANTLNYNLYTNAARTSIWGDGTAGTSIIDVKGVRCRRVGSTGGCPHTVYGRIPGPQPLAVPSATPYTANITAILTYN